MVGSCERGAVWGELLGGRLTSCEGEVVGGNCGRGLCGGTVEGNCGGGLWGVGC